MIPSSFSSSGRARRARLLAGAALVVAWPVAARAVGFEIAVHAGRTLPFFRETLRYDPSALIRPVPSVTLRPIGPLSLDARSAQSFSGGATLFFTQTLGIELRVDSLEAEFDVQPPSYDVSVAAQPPLPGFDARLDLLARDARLQRVRPVSLNLRLVTPGRTRLSLSGGVTRVGLITATGQLVGTLQAAPGVALPFTSAQARLAADAPPDDSTTGRYGLNGGVGVQFGFGANLALSAEVRGFVFKERTLSWRVIGPAANVVEEAVQKELAARLLPLVVRPALLSANVGVALRF